MSIMKCLLAFLPRCWSARSCAIARDFSKVVFVHLFVITVFTYIYCFITTINISSDFDSARWSSKFKLTGSFSSAACNSDAVSNGNTTGANSVFLFCVLTNFKILRTFHYRGGSMFCGSDVYKKYLCLAIPVRKSSAVVFIAKRFKAAFKSKCEFD